MVGLRERTTTLVEKEKGTARPLITLFHCYEASGGGTYINGNVEVKSVAVACSSMVQDVYLLKAFETGADAVVVITCPEGQCRHLDGNIRASRRVERVKRLLADIGWEDGRLSIHQVPQGDERRVNEIIGEIAEKLVKAG